MSGGVKRALKDAMGQLDELAGKDAFSSDTYDRMAKALKQVHEAAEAKQAEGNRRTAKLYAVEAPHTLLYAPDGVCPYDEEFVTDLLRLKRQQLDRRLRDVADSEKREAQKAANVVQLNEWVGEVVEHYLGPPCASFPTSGRVEGIRTLAEVDGDLFEEPMRTYVEGELMEVWCACRCDEDEIDTLEMACLDASALQPWLDRCTEGECPKAGERKGKCTCGHASSSSPSSEDEGEEAATSAEGRVSPSLALRE